MTLASTPATLSIQGIRLVNLAMDEAVAAIEAALISRAPTKINFVNADCVNIAVRDRHYRHTLSQADWVFVDGIGMRVAGHVLGQKVRDNVNGTDLFPRLCAMMARQGQRLFLYGAEPGVAAAAAAWAQERYPGLQIAGTRDGYHPSGNDVDVVEQIRASRPDVLLVALGAPRQETWIERNFPASGAIVALGVGGLFDYYSGRIPRAPTWMRRMGLEWVFRLIQEPRRLWRRYVIGNVTFLWSVAAEWHAQRGSSSRSAS